MEVLNLLTTNQFLQTSSKNLQQSSIISPKILRNVSKFQFSISLHVRRNSVRSEPCFLWRRVDTVSLLLECHPELVSPYTAYGGAIYAHTPLHLASRNGHRFDRRFTLEYTAGKLFISPAYPPQGSCGDDLEDGVRHQRPDVARHGAPRGGHLRQGLLTFQQID